VCTAGKQLLSQVLLTLRKSVEVDSRRQDQEQERTAAVRLRDMQQKQIGMLNATVAALHGQLHQYQQKEGDVVSHGGRMWQL
jgi:endonuclease YncB( thermonuclease family)